MRTLLTGAVSGVQWLHEHLGEVVSAENIASLVVAAALVLYLVAALIFPERF